MKKYDLFVDLKRGLLRTPHGDTALLAMETDGSSTRAGETMIENTVS